MIETKRLWALWLVWVGASWVGLILGMGIGNWILALVLVSAQCGEPLYDSPACRVWTYLALALSSLVCGGVIGLLQSRALRLLHITLPARWVPSSMLGWMAGMILGIGLLPLAIGSPSGDALRYGSVGAVYGITGAVIGGVQWWALRSRLANAAWWIPATILATALWGTVSAWTGGNPATWSVAGAITGGVLVWLLRRHSPALIAA